MKRKYFPSSPENVDRILNEASERGELLTEEIKALRVYLSGTYGGAGNSELKPATRERVARIANLFDPASADSFPLKVIHYKLADIGHSGQLTEIRVSRQEIIEAISIVITEGGELEDEDLIDFVADGLIDRFDKQIQMATSHTRTDDLYLSIGELTDAIQRILSEKRRQHAA